ncbi:NrpR regulatory domain-containing protein [Methanosphaera sp. ISO3-F5]|uniref:NrpR regulatory domain-containing protein n=1 Tax=Methanosphaera sp. ISO3-F5 TaxID=1452353 RepID=UPI002B2580A4|nr:NrpR regulatory domain-containing protein [Methanosphaera sp. ISO3-F5]WQH65135.1 NrpR regulatory domain-containing protein [Methanosphaera sp. ISO3-F5]
MKMMEILRILYNENEILGAKVISEELNNRGYSLGERAVRYHMHILDEKGLTEKIGYKGRKITSKGIDELKKGLIYDQVDFTYSRFQEKMYNVSLDYNTSKGLVIVNLSSINEVDSKDIIDEFFKNGLAVSQKYNFYEQNNETYIETVCGTTIDGVFQKNGIVTKPLYGGLLKVEDYTPINFIEQISYEKTSITPLEAFTSHDNTSVLDVANDGTGVIPANFRIIPASKRDDAIKIINKLSKIGVGGVIHVGEAGKSVLGIPVPENMIGIVIIGGVAPLCAAQESGYDLNIKLADSFAEYSQMSLVHKNVKLPLKKCSKKSKQNVSFVLNKIYNLISNVDYDIESFTGNVISNISYIEKTFVDDAIEILDNLYKNKQEYCMGNNYALVDEKDDKIGIATICSLTIDGILTNYGINVNPVYSGILDIYKKNRRFIELVSYKGSSVDPHEIFIKKNMHDINGSLSNDGKILASVHTVPYVSRDASKDILDIIKKSGFDVLKLGQTNEYMYNAKIEKYHFGYVVPGGLNPIAAIKEEGIPVDVKSIERIMDYSSFEEL